MSSMQDVMGNIDTKVAVVARNAQDKPTRIEWTSDMQSALNKVRMDIVYEADDVTFKEYQFSIQNR